MDRGGRFYRNNMNLARALMYSAIFFLAPSMGSGEVAKPIACPAHITSKAEALPGSPPYLAQKLSVQESYGNLPHYFIENRGQMDKRVSYFTNAQRHAIYFTIDGILFSPHQVKTGTQMKAAAKTAVRSTETRGTIQASPSSAIKLQPLEMCPGVKLVGLEPQEGKVNYLIGNDRKKWHSDIPAYGAVLYREAYPGIDLKFYGVSRKLEYDIIVKPGGDLTKVKFQYQGVKGLKVTKEGDLSITLPDGSELMQQKPVVYQQIAGQAVAREGSFKIHRGPAPGVYGFEVGAYDKRYPLVIDPVIVYSTYLGGSNYDVCYDIAVDQAGCAYITGETYSTDFPGMNGAPGPNQGDADVFVAKINAAGNALVYAAYVGGSHDDTGYAIAVDKDGNACVTGTTYSDDFPTKNPFQSALMGAPDVFVCKLNALGNDLVYSSFLGGTADEEGYAIALDGSGNTYVTGYTGSDDFPTKDPFQLHLAGFYNAFVTKVSSAGALVYSTYLGGTVEDQGNGIAADGDGYAYVTGYTSSPEFPTQSPLQKDLMGNHNAFATKVAPGGNTLVYSTFLGGSADDEGYAIAVDGAGNTYLTGHASSTDFPTQSPLQAKINGDADAFVSKIDSAGTALIFSTYLGGSSSEDYAEGITVDSAGNVYIAGWTGSADFPLKAPFQSQLKGLYNAFVAKIGSAGGALVYSTYLGGAGIDQAYGIALDPKGKVYVAGGTNSNNFPAVNSFQANLNGTDDGFITKIKEIGAIAGPLNLLLLD